MPWLLLICIYFFSDFLHFDTSLLLLSAALRGGGGVSNKHCLLSLFSFVANNPLFVYILPITPVYI